MNKGDELFTRIRISLAEGVKEFLTRLRQEWPGEKMYSFLFELPCEGSHAHAAAATEEGLSRVAKKYAGEGYSAKNGETRNALSTWLRWAGPEDGWYQGNEIDCFVPVSKLLDEAISKGMIVEYDEQLNGLALEVLIELDRSGLFGVGSDREAIVLGMCYIGGDNSDAEFLGWAERVNPPAVMTRLKREISESRSIYEKLELPRD